MPELPEVETVVRALREPLVGRRFVGLESFWPKQLVVPDDVGAFTAGVVGHTAVSISRRGKYILIQLDQEGGTLIVHLKMTGHLAVVEKEKGVHPHVRQRFLLADGAELHFRDPRKFGRLYLVTDPENIVGKLGPEPLEEGFTPALLAERLAGRQRAIKPILLDQTVVAGIGNIYADEALFGAGILPTRAGGELTAVEIHRLHAAIQTALALGIAREGASITNYVKPDGTKGSMQEAVTVFRRTGFPCYTCGTPIQRIVLAGRSTHFCPTCQR
jgi:formamidopyrimidine-DNA glycosylase